MSFKTFRYASFSFDVTYLFHFLQIDDFRKLEEIAGKSKSITIVGGSFLGSELANSLNRRFGKRGLRVYQVLLFVQYLLSVIIFGCIKGGF